ncbi:MAG: restriction endonuclease subunit S [Streptomycetaceae bacterium]|nr:restriction endonuclease subunit S [Streptomycetaceae bacterium]
MTGTLATLPDGWKITRLDRIATVNARIGWKALTAAEYQDEGYAFLATPNIKGRDIDFDNVNYISEFRYNESPELRLKVDDVLLAKDGNTLGIANIVERLPQPATVNGSIAVLRSFGMHPRFLRYVIASDFIQGHIGAVKDGMGVPHLFQWDIKRFALPEPPIEEQRRIADFLDTETARIDALLDARRRQIALVAELWESRLAAEIERLISIHGLILLGRLVRSVEQGWSPRCEEILANSDEWAVLKTSAVSSGVFRPLEHKKLPVDVQPDVRYEILDGDLLMTRGSGSSEHVGVATVACPEGRNLLLSDLLYRVRMDREWMPEFTALTLRSRPVRGYMSLLFRGQSGQTIKLRAQDVKGIQVPNVPPAEQFPLITALTAEERSAGRARAAIERSSALLAERRQALITAAVTGQLDVTTARPAHDHGL